jgi:hypothetical protein
MSTLQHTRRTRNAITARPGTALIAMSTLVAIGLALLILMTAGHRTPALTAAAIKRPLSHAAVTVETVGHAGCFRDPANHARTCFPAARALTATPTRAGYFRDPATHKLVRIPAAPRRARHRPSHRPSGGAAL